MYVIYALFELILMLKGCGIDNFKPDSLDVEGPGTLTPKTHTGDGRTYELERPSKHVSCVLTLTIPYLMRLLRMVKFMYTKH